MPLSVRRTPSRIEIPFLEPEKKKVSTRRRAIITTLPNSSLVVTDYLQSGPRVAKSVTSNEGNKSLNGIQLTVSESHPQWVNRKKISGLFHGDLGGPFFSQRRYVRILGETWHVLVGSEQITPTWLRTARYQGCVIPHAMLLDGARWPQYQSSSNAQLDAAGTTAIARCKPAQPLAGLANALIELRREGLPKLVGAATWKARTAQARRRVAGGEYLNIEFGWKPLVNDIASVAVVASSSDILMNQYRRDAGKQIRRGYEFPIYRFEETTVVLEGVSPTLMGPSTGTLYKTGLSNQGRIVRNRKIERRCWFEGAFIYHLPFGTEPTDEDDDRALSLSKLLGFDLTPDTIWNAAPWSWAIDYFVNLGDVISNLQSWTVDGMVLRYGYVMEHTVCTDTYSFAGETGFQSKITLPVVSFVAETKIRRKATPFGFGLSYGSLSNRQMAILSALGIARSK